MELGVSPTLTVWGLLAPNRAVAISERQRLHRCVAPPTGAFLALSLLHMLVPQPRTFPTLFSPQAPPNPRPLQWHFFQEALHLVRTDLAVSASRSQHLPLPGGRHCHESRVFVSADLPPGSCTGPCLLCLRGFPLPRQEPGTRKAQQLLC